ncbi:MAG: hypothetical protein KC587_15115, partial [Nitrospira sp.]|nr:hypothetical protein [Nitrospira sp.]
RSGERESAKKKLEEFSKSLKNTIEDLKNIQAALKSKIKDLSVAEQAWIRDANKENDLKVELENGLSNSTGILKGLRGKWAELNNLLKDYKRASLKLEKLSGEGKNSQLIKDLLTSQIKIKKHYLDNVKNAFTNVKNLDRLPEKLKLLMDQVKKDLTEWYTKRVALQKRIQAKDNVKTLLSMNGVTDAQRVIQNHFIDLNIDIEKVDFPQRAVQRNPFLAYAGLWAEEAKLEAMKEALRETIVNVFFTAYPGVPDPTRLKDEFANIPGHLRVLVYQWVRSLWVEALNENIIAFPGTLQSESVVYLDLVNSRVNRLGVLGNHFLDRLPDLSSASRKAFLEKLKSQLLGLPDLAATSSFILSNQSHFSSGKEGIDNTEIDSWIDTLMSDQKLMDELSVLLIDDLYGPLWSALGKLSTIERHPVPYDDIQPESFEQFAHWAKPHVQDGIQIVDLLPASRDDLVSMSINEGGAVANLAAQGEAAVAYDLNKLKMGLKVLDSATEAFDGEQARSAGESAEPIDGFDTTSTKKQRVSDAEELLNRSSLREAAKSFGYSLGAQGKGSVYARAKAALAYSKRREYLDAAITASGRGDHFAKWVVRPSDMREALGQIGTGRLVAAAHNGFPNGDQPFHLLVKVPNRAKQTDWNGKEYILFNSAYTATKRMDLFKYIGWLGLLPRGVTGVLNPAWWDDIEESVVGTVYPFKWNVESSSQQKELLTVPNNLGGRLYLDETDKVKYSEVRTLVEAEGAFIKATRSAQSGRLNELMKEIETEAAEFRGKTRETIKTRIQEDREYRNQEREKNKTTERIQELKNSEEQPGADPAE